MQESKLSDNSHYIIEKAKYQKELRLLHEVTHEQFIAKYEIHKININGMYAQVFLTEDKTFYYSGETIQSALSEDFEIFLIKHGEKWFVFDMFCDDGFDSIYRKTDFDAITAINEFANIYKNRPITTEVMPISSEGQNNDISSQGAVYYTQSISYNRDNAVNYAYTYSKSGEYSFPGYYNANFLRIHTNYGWKYSADCMNFVSQCFYAGFYGSNDTASIDGGNFPQDIDGSTASSRWYAKPTSTYWAWTAVTPFNNYIQTCASSTSGTRMTALQYSFPEAPDENADGFTFSTPYSLKGALAEVTGSEGPYGHAVLITTENGKNRDQLYYTAHTSDAKHILFSISYPSCPVRIIIPVSMDRTTQCSGGNLHAYSTYTSTYGQDSTCNHCGYCKLYVKNTLRNCVKIGSTITLAGTTSQTVYRLAMKVVSPSGVVTWLGEETCTDSYSCAFQFNQEGLYTITLYARDLNPDIFPDTSISISNTYTIRCYV